MEEGGGGGGGGSQSEDQWILSKFSFGLWI